jgi:DNA polymerase-4
MRPSSSGTSRTCAACRWWSAETPEHRGVVAAASYEARQFGVRSAMPMARAVRLCPLLVIVRPDFSRYQRVSQQVFAIFRSVTPLVEPLSLDEAYLDVTEKAWGEALGQSVAQRIKHEIKERTGLTASGRLSHRTSFSRRSRQAGRSLMASP